MQDELEGAPHVETCSVHFSQWQDSNHLNWKYFGENPYEGPSVQDITVATSNLSDNVRSRLDSYWGGCLLVMCQDV